MYSIIAQAILHIHFSAARLHRRRVCAQWAPVPRHAAHRLPTRLEARAQRQFAHRNRATARAQPPVRRGLPVAHPGARRRRPAAATPARGAHSDPAARARTHRLAAHEALPVRRHAHRLGVLVLVRRTCCTLCLIYSTLQFYFEY